MAIAAALYTMEKETIMFPTLVFGKENPHNNTPGEVLNTFRAGTKWADMLVPGQVVKFAYYDTNEDFGIATVLDVDVGHFTEMKDYLASNQTWRDYSQEDAELGILVEMGRVYPDFDPITDKISVITYVRMDPEASEKILAALK